MSLNISALLKVLGDLKHLRRTGWVNSNVPEPETVACHMYRMAMLALAIDGHDVDRMKCVRMALVHDLGEAIVGDITPSCGISNGIKYQLEKEAMQKICEFVPKNIGEDWISLWQEYENGKTNEAIITKHLDKFDMIAQAFEYEQKYNLDLEDFFISTRNSFQIEPFVGWVSDLQEKRREWKQNNSV